MTQWAPPWRLNIGLTLAFVIAHLIALIFLPTVDGGIRISIAMLICLGVATTPMWALIHEAIHGVLLPKPRANARPEPPYADGCSHAAAGHSSAAHIGENRGGRRRIVALFLSRTSKK